MSVDIKSNVVPVWMTVKLGVHKTPDAYRIALREAGCPRIFSWQVDLLGMTICAQNETEVKLVARYARELGFREGGYRKDIFDRGVDMGLRLCPAEVGPALRLAYKNQPRGESLRIAMEPLPDVDGLPCLFAVCHGEDGQRLYDSFVDGLPPCRGEADDLYVFLHPES